MRRLALAVACALLLAAPATAAPAPSGPVYDGHGHLVQTPFAPPPARPHLTQERVLEVFAAKPKVHGWLRHYPRPTWQTEAKFDAKTQNWTVKIWSGKAGEVATGSVSDGTQAVMEAWTGPQVAWKMARGYDGAFGGKKINEPWLWLTFCGIFLVGLTDWRRPLSLRNLDLLALLSFSISLWFFNRGDTFTSMPLVYPGLVYLLARTALAGLRGRPPTAPRSVWPVWVLAAAALFVTGFRIGLNVQESNVIDVGYAGPIGADRIWHGESPYGNFPREGDLKGCGPASADGEVRDRIQTNGRCETANEAGDTYGPFSYLAYLPGYWILGWSGKWDSLPAAHFTAIVFDVLCILGLALVGRRFGGARLAATLAFAWAAYPFTQYASNSNTNDAIPAAFLIWGFWLVSRPGARGAFCAFAGWTKFAAFIVAPLWLTYPERRLRPALIFLAGFLVASGLGLWVLLLDPDPLLAARVFWDRTVGYQLGRHSPFSIWDWAQYHAGLPDLHVLQRVLQGVLVVGALALALRPRRKSPYQLAALSGALLVGFELVLTHWFYLYIPWFFPFVAYAVLAAEARPEREPIVAAEAAAERELVRAA